MWLSMNVTTAAHSARQIWLMVTAITSVSEDHNNQLDPFIANIA